MLTIFESMLVSHLTGDFLLQTDWMQAKSKSSFVCTAHVLAYSVPFWFMGLPPVLILLVMAQHWLQDRFALHLKWMRFCGQSKPDKWPTGPLIVDQVLHILWMAALAMPVRI